MSDEKPAYIIVTADTLFRLREAVIEKMADGYEPLGAPLLNKPEYNQPVYLQAMTLKP